MKTKIVIEAFIPDTAIAPTADWIADVRKLADKHKCLGFFASFSGPFDDGYVPEQLRGNNVSSNRNPRTRGSGDADGGTGDGKRLQSDAAADFADAEPDAEAGKPAGRKPRSDAGKPRGTRGSGEKAGQASEGPERAEGRSRGEGRARRNGDDDAPQGSGKGSGQGEGRERESGRGRGRAGSSDGRDAETSGVAAADEDWGGGSKKTAVRDDDKPGKGGKSLDEGPEFDSVEEADEWWAKTPDEDGWPDNLMPEEDPLTSAVMSGLMSDHYRASGGKNKDLTFELLHEMTGKENLDEIHEDDYDALARALLRETAQYKYGIRKAPKATRGK